MITKVKFTKMHGAGNDYIYVNAAQYHIKDPEKTSIDWSNRHTGIGSDGLVLIGPSEIADFSMRIFNADGSEAMMCGNASRCVGKYVYEKGLTEKQEVTLETLSGIKTLKLHVTGAEVNSVTVDMGIPSDIKEVDLGEPYNMKGITVNMGNPHLVIFVDNVEEIDLPVIGPKLENHPLFPNRTNVEFGGKVPRPSFPAASNRRSTLVKPGCSASLPLRVWERGSGITMACGTGACATAVAAITKGIADRKVDIAMDGGTLTIEWEKETGHVMMTGPAEIVFEGEIETQISAD